MENKRISGIEGSVVGKGPYGVRLRLDGGETDWFKYGKDEKASSEYKSVTEGLAIGDIVVVDAVVQEKDGKKNYYLRSIKPRNGTKPAQGTEVVKAEGDHDARALLTRVLEAVERVESKQTGLEAEFAALKESLGNMVGGLGHLTPSEKSKTCHVLAVNLVENAFTNGDIGASLGSTLDEFSKTLKGKILPLIRDIAESIGDDLERYEEKLGTIPGDGRPSL